MNSPSYSFFPLSSAASHSHAVISGWGIAEDNYDALCQLYPIEYSIYDQSVSSKFSPGI
jgi:hypothetical protein